MCLGTSGRDSGVWGTLDKRFQAQHPRSQVLVWLSFRLTCKEVPS